MSRVSSRSVKQECQERVQQECPARVSRKSVKKECQEKKREARTKRSPLMAFATTHAFVVQLFWYSMAWGSLLLVLLQHFYRNSHFPKKEEKMTMLLLTSGVTSGEWRPWPLHKWCLRYIDVALQCTGVSTLAIRSSCAFAILQFVPCAFRLLVLPSHCGRITKFFYFSTWEVNWDFLHNS